MTNSINVNNNGECDFENGDNELSFWHCIEDEFNENKTKFGKTSLASHSTVVLQLRSYIMTTLEVSAGLRFWKKISEDQNRRVSQVTSATK